MEIVEQYTDTKGKRQWFTLNLSSTEKIDDERLKDIISKLTVIIQKEINKEGKNGT